MLIDALRKDVPEGADLSVRAAERWVQTYEVQNSWAALESNPATIDQRDEIETLHQALDEVELNIQQYNPNARSSQRQTALLGDMYNFLGMKQKKARLLGYDTQAEMVLSRNRVPSLADIRLLHELVAAAVHPFTQEEISEPIHFKALDEHLKSSQLHLSRNARNHRNNDQASVLRLERHVTLDGAMSFLSSLCNDLFGVCFEESDGGVGWHDSVKVYHVHEKDTFVGSVFLDPFSRSGKTNRPMTSTILNRGEHHAPMVALSLCIDPPSWDTDPAFVSWDNVEALFHEMGHVLHILMSRQTLGTFLGPQEAPFDLSELLPKFMEHWLTEKSTIVALIELSGPPNTMTQNLPVQWSEDILEKTFRQRSREKTFRLAQQCFYGSLEIELFSSFDVRGDEKLIDLQHRLATELIPHDCPDRHDLTPLLEVFQENANGREVAWYRYLWADFHSAAIFSRFRRAYEDEPSKALMLRKAFTVLISTSGLQRL